jgi:hypothetical protein
VVQIHPDADASWEGKFPKSNPACNEVESFEEISAKKFLSWKGCQAVSNDWAALFCLHFMAEAHDWKTRSIRGESAPKWREELASRFSVVLPCASLDIQPETFFGSEKKTLGSESSV